MEDMHLPPLSLVLTVLFCSGFMLMFALRDFMSTGRNILGEADEDMMVCFDSVFIVLFAAVASLSLLALVLLTHTHTHVTLLTLYSSLFYLFSSGPSRPIGSTMARMVGRAKPAAFRPSCQSQRMPITWVAFLSAK
jgi:hypothetical protein